MNIKMFEWLGNGINGVLTQYTTSISTSLISSLAITATVCTSLYFTIMGFLIIGGYTQDSFYYLMKNCLKIILVSILALNAPNYQRLVIKTLEGLESGLSSIISNNTPTDDPSTYKSLDQALSKGFSLATQCAERAANIKVNIVAGFTWSFSALLIGIGTLLLTGITATIIIVTKFLLTIMFSIGPLFIMSLIWPPTAKFFDAWISQTFKYIFTLVLMVIVTSFAVKIFETIVTKTNFETQDILSPTLISLQTVAYSLILTWIVLQVGSMSSGLSGGVSMATTPLKNILSPIEFKKSETPMKSQGAMGTTNVIPNNTSETSNTPAYRTRTLEKIKGE